MPIFRLPSTARPAAAALFLAFCSCTTVHPPVDCDMPDGRQRLAARLAGLDASVDPGEARLAAETAYAHSLALAREYRAVSPAFVHNMLVNTSLRKRGLCYQWAEDLEAKLVSLHLRTLQIHRSAARPGTSREHSGVVLTACGQDFPSGIVLDAWRHSGRLFWSGVTEDRYPWIRVEVVDAEAPPVEEGGSSPAVPTLP